MPKLEPSPPGVVIAAEIAFAAVLLYASSQSIDTQQVAESQQIIESSPVVTNVADASDFISPTDPLASSPN